MSDGKLFKLVKFAFELFIDEIDAGLLWWLRVGDECELEYDITDIGDELVDEICSQFSSI